MNRKQTRNNQTRNNQMRNKEIRKQSGNKGEEKFYWRTGNELGAFPVVAFLVVAFLVVAFPVVAFLVVAFLVVNSLVCSCRFSPSLQFSFTHSLSPFPSFTVSLPFLCHSLFPSIHTLPFPLLLSSQFTIPLSLSSPHNLPPVLRNNLS